MCIIKFVNIQYREDKETEIIPVDRIDKWVPISKTDFKKKFPTPPQFDVFWYEPLDQEWVIVSAIIHQVGDSQEDVQKQVNDDIAKNKRLQKPTIRAIESASQEIIDKIKCKRRDKNALVDAAKMSANRQIISDAKQRTGPLQHTVKGKVLQVKLSQVSSKKQALLDNRENFVAEPDNVSNNINEDKKNEVENEEDELRKIQEMREIQQPREVQEPELMQEQELVEEQRAIQQQRIEQRIDVANNFNFEKINNTVRINEAVIFNEAVWHELERTKKPSVLVRNTAIAIWGNDLKNKCLDLKAGARHPGQVRSICSPRKLDALYDVVHNRFIKIKKTDGPVYRGDIISFSRKHLSQKITDLNADKIPIRELRRLREIANRQNGPATIDANEGEN
ncbi:BEN domain-containing protein 5-like [Leptopilina heterotoma]|uniref:BEN domain-containing protein 5-like n=1 Tax=Leptopilina heterotoma TaxID=63436 RepID=UPI001CA7D617|nr:BEN domain-containing protein 5-like [Leptopilina heterotoma]